MSFSRLESVISDLGASRIHARELARFLYRSNSFSLDELTTLPESLRTALKASFRIGASPPVDCHLSDDGSRKYIFEGHDRHYVEAVYIPEANRHTLCISSQAGCRMGCVFCATGSHSWHGGLTIDRILNQVRSLPERQSLTHVVFMGMGEPFDNTLAVIDSVNLLTSHQGFGFAPRKVSVSTSGVPQGILAYLKQCSSPLALSVHSPFAEERRQWMPIENKFPLQECLAILRHTPRSSHRRIFIEYLVFKGKNHSDQHAEALAHLLKGIPCRVNLMRYHPVATSALEPPDTDTLLVFRHALQTRGLTVTLRRSRGYDIHAACGQLASSLPVQSPTLKTKENLP